MKIYRVMAALALIALIGGFVLLGGQHEHSPSPSPVITREIPQEPDGYAAKDARLVQTGPDGRPLYIVEAEHMQQHPGLGTVDMEQVQVGFHDDTGNLWQATGNHGVLGQTTGQVDLAGNVHAYGLLPGTQNEANLNTEHLHVDTQAQKVRTQDPVTMVTSDQHNQVHSLGLYADLKTGHVVLESNVHGVYLP
jgi:lipopolysaccharide export system protein LptC